MGTLWTDAEETPLLEPAGFMVRNYGRATVGVTVALHLAFDRRQPRRCLDVTLAERELTAFAAAVRELFGPEQASLSSAEWIDELESLNWPAEPRASDFRRITAVASSRLAHRRLFRSRMGSDQATSSSPSDQK